VKPRRLLQRKVLVHLPTIGRQDDLNNHQLVRFVFHTGSEIADRFLAGLKRTTDLSVRKAGE
jgi:hypothetical protein